LELVGQPLVIVVAEGEQLAVGVQDAAVAGTGQRKKMASGGADDQDSHVGQ
jgi:hypothetical protein